MDQDTTMITNTVSVMQRAVDSLQKIYAVVIALAISQAIQSLLKDPSNGSLFTPKESLIGLPMFVAFLATLVPFWHGMNRHLDRCYLEKEGRVNQGAMLFDFAIFFLEATILFAAGWMLHSGIRGFVALGALLVVDSVWGFISHQIHFPDQPSHVRKWAAINGAAIFLAILVGFLPYHQFTPYVLMSVALARTIVDYTVCWKFYFPPQ
jgi:hypothetical protein